MKTLTLPTGESVMVDDDDFVRVSQYKWHRATKYAARNLSKSGGQPHRVIAMHREIMGVGKGQQLDHINGNGLDNRKDNLRIATNQENARAMCRKRITGNYTSRFRGVSKHTQNGNWRAVVSVDGKQHHVGCYASEEAAAMAYNARALELGFFKEALNKL